jgi:hypothetical protein
MTKEEILAQMKLHQAEYSKLNEQFKLLKAADEREGYVKKMNERVTAFKARYPFYANMDGTVETINWEQIEVWISGGLKDGNGYGIGWDDTGMPGLGYADYSGGSFRPMVETEEDCKKYVERELKRQEIASRKK